MTAKHWKLMDVRELESGEAEMQLHYSPLREVFRVSVCVENDLAEEEFDATADPIILGVSKDDNEKATNLAERLAEKLQIGMD